MKAPEREPGRHLALVGPTASGKSAVGLALAVMRTAAGLPTEIISVDSMQVYRGMDIGTAKPTIAEQELVPHHLIDVVEPTEEHNLPMFLRAARAALDEIESRGASAILLGGTGLYVRGMVDGFDPPPQFPAIVGELEAEPDTVVLTQRLSDLDPLALERIPPGNRRRIIRALEVTLGTGTPFSSHGEPLDTYSPTPFVLTGLRPERDDLTSRINARYSAQMQAGLAGEAEALNQLGDRLSRTAGQALGYRELMDHLRGEVTEAEALETARVRTRRFAVRQLRWFGRDPRISWFEPLADSHDVGGVATRIDTRWRRCAAERHGSVATVGAAPPDEVGSVAPSPMEEP